MASAIGKNRNISVSQLVGAILLLVVSLISFALLYGFLLLKGSLPQLDGVQTLTGLERPVNIMRDKQGLATIQGQNRLDLAFATGFLHGQERFFQMDLSRRRSAGELAELFGQVAFNLDKNTRIHRFRARSEQIFHHLPDNQQQLLQAYANGVTAGLKHLSNKPFEYFLLQSSPDKWKPEDSLLVVYSMYLTLQSPTDNYELQRSYIQQSFPAVWAQFLLPQKTQWDAPIQPDTSPIEQPASPTQLPPAFNKAELSFMQNYQALTDAALYGSNNWAVSGNLTNTGSAILSNDMHLGLSVPNTWFRLRLQIANAQSESQNLDVTGLSLPGTPLIVVGSNGHVAWGFTNSYGDWSDLIKLKINPDNDQQYLAADHYQDFDTYIEKINIKDAEQQELIVKETQWGPVLPSSAKQPQEKSVQETQQPVAMRWVAHFLQGMNLGLMAMEQVTTVAEAQGLASTIGIPAQNAMLADSQGNIGWTIFGAIPRRKDGDYSIPQDWSQGNLGWDGWLSSDEYPKIFNPGNERLWTANARVVSGVDLQKVGDGGYALGARAHQIQQDLMQLQKPVDEPQLLSIQLDDKALFLSRWQQQLLKVLQASPSAENKTILDAVNTWDGTASKSSLAYGLVKSYRLQVAKALMEPFNQLCQTAYQNCDYFAATHQWEQPLWTMISQQKTQLLPINYLSWSQFFVEMAKKAYQQQSKKDGSSKLLTWGEKNSTHIVHPLSRFVPLLGRLTDMPTAPQSGDRDMPHVTGHEFGQSERMVVSPGHEENAILQMPTSQSGNPLSPYYGLGHIDWMQGKPTLFLPGKTQWHMTLNPLKQN